jgi:hypothetical protein
MALAPWLLAAALAHPTAPVKETYHVYGGGCSRSIRLQGTYDTPGAAFAAADVLRTEKKLGHVTVRAGAHERDHFGSAATEYRVYRKVTKCGQWVLHATVPTAAEAVKVTEELAAGRHAAGVVGFYAAR